MPGGSVKPAGSPPTAGAAVGGVVCDGAAPVAPVPQLDHETILPGL